MPFAIEENSTVTSKGQTTVPKVVREVLGLGPGDQIAYRVGTDGTVLMSKQDASQEEAAIDAFLAFLSGDIKANPGGVTELSEKTSARRRALAAGVQADIDGDFSGADPL